MRRSRPAATLAAAVALLGAPLLAPCPVLAQTSPSASPSASPAAPAAVPIVPSAAPPAAPMVAPAADTVIAKVGPDVIRYADLQEAMQTLPEQLRALPPNMLYPMLLDQLVDRDVIVLQAKKENLQDDPKVKLAIQRATEQALQNGLLARDIQPLLTPEALQARYDKEYAGKTGEEQARAEHILVATEAKAREIIAQLQKGGDFADLAKKNSTDPSAAQNSGELGWFKKGDMLPEFSDAAFALKPGEITTTPVHTRFGWHVIKLEEKRTAPAPKLDEVRDDIRRQIIQEGVAKVLASAKQGVAIEKFNLDGTSMVAAPDSTPAPAPATPGK